MPGFILQIASDSEKRHAAYQAIAYNSMYSMNTLYENDNVTLSFNSYKSYPKETYESETFYCLVEGYMYGVNTTELINDLLGLLESNFETNISERIENIDGEFVLVFINKNNHSILIINDSWGRLPIYYIQKGDSLIITREISFIKNYYSDLAFSQTDLALYAMFGYTLGDFTFYENVYKLAPHSTFTFKELTSSLQVTSAFELKKLFTKCNEGNLQKLKENLTEALTTRLSKFHKPSLSLSGGLDSRLIAGIWATSQYPKLFTTFVQAKLHTQMDAEVAKKISQSLGPHVLHKIIPLETTTEAHRERIIGFKSGMNGQEMAFLIPYLDKVAECSDCTITGDGGDKFFVDLFPLNKVTNGRQTLNSIIKFNSTLSLKQAALLSGVSKEDILDRISAVLDGYGLTDAREIYAAFLIRERGINWLFEGEDRNRFILWSTSPYYSPKVITESMKFPMNSKIYGNLFKELFKTVPGQLIDLINPNWMQPLSATQKVKWVHDKQRIKSKIPKAIMKQKGILLEDSQIYEIWKNLDRKPPLDLYKLENKKLSTSFFHRLETLMAIS